ncbi:acyl-CoA synthetase [Candidatus Viridilinea mediisalina]|uniref:Long-chain fatty acid--CoA ligase n=1 Tax=Candidatus Viridilinea mediisalina TaxID=2024553 RepID=A0A2A6RJ92_9CHLR|nr:acyl-CoA synthetase [Candidatus Viridilinea mediisalina]PDW02959.1 long-chain fatty acid--CoA ligase [Candidatus Viridilinea mediisalina]
MSDQPPSSIIAALLHHAATDPERPCLQWGGQTLSYSTIVDLAAGWAEHFLRQGVQRGDRVGLFLPSSPTFLVTYLGIQMVGGIAVLINSQYRQVELNHILSDSEPRVVVCDADGIAYIGAPAGSVGAKLVVTTGEVQAKDASSWRGELPRPNELALLVYTSGTTGRAKGAMLTHGALTANSAAVTAAWHWTAADHLLLVLPLFHIHGLGVGFHGTLWSGARLTLRPRFVAEESLEALRSGEYTLFFGVPTMYTRIIEVARAQTVRTRGKPPRIKPLPLRLCVSGSAPLAPQTLQEFETRFGHRILERYGMSETGMNLGNPYEGERRAGTVGQPFPGQEARVVDMQSGEPLPDGEIGEIQVRGPHVGTGYWGNPQATVEVFHDDGWFSTGDLGWRSDDGYFTITGRARELIISGGYNIYPREIEEVLLNHPAVAECAVFGQPDPDLGEHVVAAIVPRNPAQPPTRNKLINYCNEHLAAYKRPRSIHILEALPRNAMGKVQKELLKQQMGL